MNKIIIIGAGPSALFAAKTILENSHDITVELFEQGKEISLRHCDANKTECTCCDVCDTLQGVGGAGLFSDGKLVLDLTSGGLAAGVASLSKNEQKELETLIRDTFVAFDGVSEFKEMPSQATQETVKQQLSNVGLDIKFYDVLHMGTRNLQNITNNFVDYLAEKYNNRFVITTETRVLDVKNEKGQFCVVTDRGDYPADVVIAAVGKTGSSWLASILNAFHCNTTSSNFYFGFRLEMPATSIADMIEYSFDPKISTTVGGRKIKLHCVCRRGEIRYLRYRNTTMVGGHSPTTAKTSANSSSKNANFNVLCSYNKNEFSSEVLLQAFRKSCGNRVMVQRLKDFFANASTEKWGDIIPDNPQMAQPGNIRNIIDSLDQAGYQIIREFLFSMAKLYPGVMHDDNLLYAPVIEWDMDTINVNNNMETSKLNLFAIGDGAGLSQGIVYSAATGIIAAREIVRRFSEVQDG